MKIVRNHPTNRSTESETSTLTTTTHIVNFPAAEHNDWTAYDQTYGVRWRITNATTGRIAAIAIFDELEGDVAAGPIFDPPERERLARRLCATLGVWDDNLIESIEKCLSQIARSLLMESAA